MVNIGNALPAELRVEVPVTPFKVAIIVAVPMPAAVASPAGVIVATLEALVVQATWLVMSLVVTL